MSWVNLSQYGKIRGVSSEAVKKAIKSGRLKNSVRQKENGKWEVNPEAANIEWDLTTNHKHRPHYKNEELNEPAPTSYQPINIAPENVPIEHEGKSSLFEAQRRHEEARAGLAELKLKEAQGELVHAGQIKEAAFKTARTVRDAIMNIPDRVAAEFAGITAAHEIHLKLTEEIRKALEALEV